MHIWITALAAAIPVVIAAQTDIARPPAQAPPARPSAVRPQEVPVTIDGCIIGRRLALRQGATADVQAAALNATEFALDGPRDLIRSLTRDHDGHEEEIRGIAVVPPSLSDATVETRTAKRGRVRVTGGVRESGGSTGGGSATVGDAKLPVRIRVTSATHVADTCSPRP